MEIAKELRLRKHALSKTDLSSCRQMLIIDMIRVCHFSRKMALKLIDDRSDLVRELMHERNRLADLASSHQFYTRAGHLK